MIAAGAALVLPRDGGGGWILFVVCSATMVLAFREQLDERQERRRDDALDFRRSVDALLDELGQRYAEVIHVEKGQQGEDALMELVRRVSFPTREVW